MTFPASEVIGLGLANGGRTASERATLIGLWRLCHQADFDPPLIVG